MKTIILAAAIALTSFTASANTETAQKKVNLKVIIAFEKEFGQVDNITWSTASKNMMRASFTQNDEKVNAFFDESGEYVASTIERTKEELPAKLRAAISKKEKDGIITEAIELQGDDEQAYYVKVYVNGVEKVYKGSSWGMIQLVNY